MKFDEMLRKVCADLDADLATVANAIDCSVQYVCDLKQGRRLPSVRITNAICTWLGRGPNGRREWHVAAARAHGWEV